MRVTSIQRHPDFDGVVIDLQIGIQRHGPCSCLWRDRKHAGESKTCNLARTECCGVCLRGGFVASIPPRDERSTKSQI